MVSQLVQIRLKKEIVTIGDESIDPTHLVGEYLEPNEWNRLIEDKDYEHDRKQKIFKNPGFCSGYNFPYCEI